MTVLICLTFYLWSSLMLLHVIAVSCMVYPFIEWICCSVVMHSNIEGYLCCFQQLAIVNSSLRSYLYLENFGIDFYLVHTMEKNSWLKGLVYLALEDQQNCLPKCLYQFTPQKEYTSLVCSPYPQLQDVLVFLMYSTENEVGVSFRF